MELNRLYEKHKYSNIIYMDNSATTIPDITVIEEMLPYFVLNYGNPSSVYSMGKISQYAIQTSKKQIAKLINCKTNELYFTSCGSESNNWVLNGVLGIDGSKNHIITSKIEHKSILNTCEFLDNTGRADITYINVNEKGFIDLQLLEQSIVPETKLISIMLANNEVGTIQDIKAIVDIAHKYNVCIHTDATQYIGKEKIDLQELNIDFMTFSGHKLHAPKGIGVLYINENVKDFNSFIFGGSQEQGKRAGTENIANIVGLGKACEIIDVHFDIYKAYIKDLHNYMIELLKKHFNSDEILYTGSPTNRISNIISVCFKNIGGSAVVLALDSCGIECSSGSACNEDKISNSHVLSAMKIPDEFIKGSVRFSLSKYNTKEEINIVVKQLRKIIDLLQS